jgi:hypothetical protein
MLRGSLDWFLAPVPRVRFFAEYFERAPLHVVGARAGRPLLTLVDVDAALTRRVLVHPQARMAAQGKVLAPESYARPGGAIDPVAVAERLAEGATLIVDGVEDWHYGVARACRTLGREVLGAAWANLYLTPRASRGFAAHADDHDVLVLQLQGSKDWSLYAPPATFPALMPVAKGSLDAGPPVATLTMRAGDVLYIPRGHAHSAAASDSESLHVTIAYAPPTWAALAKAAIDVIAAEDERFRHALPLGALRGKGGGDSLRGAFGALLGDVARRADSPRALGALAADVARSRRALVPGAVAQALAAGPPALGTVVGVRPGLAFTVRVVGGRVEVTLPGRSVSLPRHVRRAVGYALAHRRFTSRDLPDTLDDEGKLTLVRRLVREGALRVLATK